MTNKTMGERLSSLRIITGLSIRDAAAQIGVAHTHLHGLEQGKFINPTLYTLQAIARVYKTSVSYIVGEAR